MLLFAAARRIRILAEALEDLPRASGSAVRTPPPPLTVVIAARDEGTGIARTVGRLLSQRYDGRQVVAVDDRSQDGTGAILDRVAASPAAEGRLEVVHVAALPEGWLGKCHA